MFFRKCERGDARLAGRCLHYSYADVTVLGRSRARQIREFAARLVKEA
eukprot:gene27835-33666_t